MGLTLDCFGKGIEITQSNRPEEAIPDSRQVHVNQALVLLLAVTQLRPGNEVVSTK